MRVLLLTLFACTLFALPLSAQASRSYQPPSKDEMAQLRKQDSAPLREVRGGNTSSRARLHSAELRQLQALAKAHPVEWNLLRELRGGRHVHGWWDNWVWYFLVPGIATTVLVLILLLILLVII